MKQRITDQFLGVMCAKPDPGQVTYHLMALDLRDARSEVKRLLGALQEVCRHPVSIDSMPAFCGICGAELP